MCREEVAFSGSEAPPVSAWFSSHGVFGLGCWALTYSFLFWGFVPFCRAAFCLARDVGAQHEVHLLPESVTKDLVSND